MAGNSKRPLIRFIDDPPGRRQSNNPVGNPDLPKARAKRNMRPTGAKHGQLNRRQQRFIEEYCIDQNASAAARRAGYSAKASRVTGFNLMQVPFIRDEIERRMKEKIKSIQVDQEAVLKRMNNMTLGDVTDLFDENGKLLHPKQLPDIIRKRVASIKVRTVEMPSNDPEGGVEIEYTHEIKLWPLDSQLTNLARTFQMFGDRPSNMITINITGGLPDDPEEWGREDDKPPEPDMNGETTPPEPDK